MQRKNFTTGMILGSIVGASSALFMNMDKRQVKKMKKTVNDMQSMMRR